MKQIAQGAEAKINLDEDKILKNRTSKSYRHPQLDQQIRKSRTKKETKLLIKSAELISVPEVLDQSEFIIKMQHINGERLSETLNSKPKSEQFQIMRQIGEQIAKLHDQNIIHGDLTTSNTILRNSQVFFIDFGLGFISTRIEDKAVDLHLIRQALEAKHFQNHNHLFFQLLEAYQPKERDKVLQQLKKVESRGRYKH